MASQDSPAARETTQQSVVAPRPRHSRFTARRAGAPVGYGLLGSPGAGVE